MNHRHQVFSAQAQLGTASFVAMGLELTSCHGCASALAHFQREMESFCEELDKDKKKGARGGLLKRKAREQLFGSQLWSEMLAKLSEVSLNPNSPPE